MSVGLVLDRCLLLLLLLPLGLGAVGSAVLPSYAVKPSNFLNSCSDAGHNVQAENISKCPKSVVFFFGGGERAGRGERGCFFLTSKQNSIAVLPTT